MQLAEREKMPDAASLRLARAQVHAEAQATNREQREALECCNRSISSKVCWDAAGLAPKLLGEKRQTYLAKLELESVERAKKMPPPKPTPVKCKKTKEGKNAASKPRCPKAMRRAAWESFRCQEEGSRAVAKAAAQAALEMAQELHRKQDQVDEQELVGRLSNRGGMLGKAGLQDASKVEVASVAAPEPWAKGGPHPVQVHVTGCAADARQQASAKEQNIVSSACAKVESVDPADLKGPKAPTENGNASPTTTLHQHSEAPGSTEDERSSEKEEPANADEPSCRNGEMDSGETKFKRLKVTIPRDPSADLSLLDSPEDAKAEERPGLENLDTSGMNDEELAKYLHHQLNAPSSRRKARSMHATLSAGGSPNMKRKRADSSTTLEGQAFTQDSPRSHKAKVANGGFSPHLFRTATS